jgi:hypothetical protein
MARGSRGLHNRWPDITALDCGGIAEHCVPDDALVYTSKDGNMMLRRFSKLESQRRS